jgi:hypothetical protein
MIPGIKIPRFFQIAPYKPDERSEDRPSNTPAKAAAVLFAGRHEASYRDGRDQQGANHIGTA